MEKLDRVRSLVFNECQANEKLQWFWNSHLAVVEELARELAKEQNADMEITMLGVYLHDIGRIRGIGEQEHDVVGVPIAEEIMRKLGYDDLVIQKVKGLILTHRCRERKPETLEEEVLATADAMSHFRGDFYLSLLWHHEQETLEGQVQFTLQKIERDFQDKIFFESAQAKIKPAYEAFKFVFSSFTTSQQRGEQ